MKTNFSSNTLIQLIKQKGKVVIIFILILTLGTLILQSKVWLKSIIVATFIVSFSALLDFFSQNTQNRILFYH